MELIRSESTTYTIQSDTSQEFTVKKHEVVENYVHISDRDVPPRAVAVLPPALQFRRNCISPRRPLPSRIRFGPVKGVTKTITNIEAKDMIAKSAEQNKPLFLLETNENTIMHIDHTDHDKANWLGLLPLGDHTTANVWIYKQENELYAVTTKTIPSRVPLMLGYSSEYMKLHGFPSDVPCIDLQQALSSDHHEWWCFECQLAMPSAALLQHHVEAEHKEKKVIRRRRHRCQLCKRSFARLFTLKRHMARYCTKKGEKQSDKTQSSDKPMPNVESETSCLLDESRVPSEEILQSFTSSIDFSSLFDSYRSLDLSNSSKSVDLIDPESQLSRDDSGLSNITDLNFINVSTNVDVNTSKSSSAVYEESAPTLNNYLAPCNEKSKTDQTQQYVSEEVPKEIYNCECGRVFLNRNKLIRHVMDHSNTAKPVESSDIIYKCEDCQLIFKRRGMFVNHLWRVHGDVSVRVPLERRVRRYPCAGCTRVYRTAAKRDRHARNHHPGAVLTSARAVEEARRACAAAACAACPRQYATRAKLLQHVRAAHPQIAPPLKRQPLFRGDNETVKSGIGDKNPSSRTTSIEIFNNGDLQ